MKASLDRDGAATLLRDAATRVPGVGAARIRVRRHRVKARADVRFRDPRQVKEDLTAALGEECDRLALARAPASPYACGNAPTDRQPAAPEPAMTQRSALNRSLLGLAGLVLLGGGLLILSAGLDLYRRRDLVPPDGWPLTAPADVLLGSADRTRWSSQGWWWWPAVIAALALVALLALWWLLAQLRRHRPGSLAVGGTPRRRASNCATAHSATRSRPRPGPCRASTTRPYASPAARPPPHPRPAHPHPRGRAGRHPRCPLRRPAAHRSPVHRPA
ncbi:DUF6286 domain-containing protein [Streptomyces nogalater]